MRISIGSSFRLPNQNFEAAVNRNDVLTSVGPGIALPTIRLPSAPGAPLATSMASAQDRAMADDILALKE